MSQKISRKRSLPTIFSDSATVNKALVVSVAKAVEGHRRAGNKIAVLRGGKIIKIDPRKIPA